MSEKQAKRIAVLEKQNASLVTIMRGLNDQVKTIIEDQKKLIIQFQQHEHPKDGAAMVQIFQDIPQAIKEKRP